MGHKPMAALSIEASIREPNSRFIGRFPRFRGSIKTENLKGLICARFAVRRSRRPSDPGRTRSKCGSAARDGLAIESGIMWSMWIAPSRKARLLMLLVNWRSRWTP